MAITRAAMRLLIPNYIRGGMSAARFIRDMKSQYGKAYRKTNVLADFRYFSGVEAATDRMKYVRKDRLPSDGVFAPGTPKAGAKFEYRVKLSGYHPDTGEAFESYVTALGDDRLSPQDIEEMMIDKYGHLLEDVAAEKGYPSHLTSATVVFGIRKE